jgi:hypothetical protein
MPRVRISEPFYMTPREQGAKILHDLCNTDDPQERDRLAKELDLFLMHFYQTPQDDPLVQRLKEWEATPKGSPERLAAFKRAIQTLYDEDGEK